MRIKHTKFTKIIVKTMKILQNEDTHLPGIWRSQQEISNFYKKFQNTQTKLMVVIGKIRIEVKNDHKYLKTPNDKLVKNLLTGILKVLDLLRRASERKTVF